MWLRREGNCLTHGVRLVCLSESRGGLKVLFCYPAKNHLCFSTLLPLDHPMFLTVYGYPVCKLLSGLGSHSGHLSCSPLLSGNLEGAFSRVFSNKE